MRRISYQKLPLARKVLFILASAAVGILLSYKAATGETLPVFFWFSTYLIIVSAVFGIAGYYSQFFQKIVLENFMSSLFFIVGIYLFLHPAVRAALPSNLLTQNLHWFLIGYSFIDALIMNFLLYKQHSAEKVRGLPKMNKS
ncbi:hypothetical protein AKJ64_00180 [candidate division MSBL1 archaeon SCGC-AAA259E17]|uniref:Uncharacterized protein n=1 Tax=candidate division MSBL1 archaeon SCGC-AAA259E17 TaxID=1698263 RepID=A0A133UHH0_9EURY|nr:hypothetical protein AKJ64_00180 [candidate division MSBL1 archaeon SCGC-AAA259E17]